MRAFWETSLVETLERSRQFADLHATDAVTWLENFAEAAPVSSNQGSGEIPFQRWFHFKEAFSPKFVADTLLSLPYTAKTCIDPFAGSGTTLLTAQFLGVDCTGIEINPFLADLAEAKLSDVDPDTFLSHYRGLISTLQITAEDCALPSGMPTTMREPGAKDRYVFSAAVYDHVRAITRSATCLPSAEARLLRVLLGSVLIENSNVIINGKGRRYRRNWQSRQRSAEDLVRSLDEAVDAAVADLRRFTRSRSNGSLILRGDARQMLQYVEKADVAIFSPPYPNSFDYTDVYNVELWMLGYLSSRSDNALLRQQTLRSHVQLLCPPRPQKAQSSRLIETVDRLRLTEEKLWSARIPDMVSNYFDDLADIFSSLRRVLGPGKLAVAAIGDSQYAGVHINVAEILAEVAANVGFDLLSRGAIRSMRNSSQHGGHFTLSEHCLVFRVR